MKLPIPPSPQEALAELEEVIPALYQAMETGCEEALQFFVERADRDKQIGRGDGRVDIDTDLHPSLVRFFAKREFDRLRVDADLFERENLRNNGLSLKPTGRFNLRILKNDDGRVPLAGSSASKLRYYQQAIPLLMLEQETQRPWNLVVLWFLNEVKGLDYLSLVCPKTADDKAVEVWWQEPIPHPATTIQVNEVTAPDDLDMTPRWGKAGTGQNSE
jgi:hypothetical protein